MKISVHNLLQQRRYPFIASLVLLLIFVTIFNLTTNTSQPPPRFRLPIQNIVNGTNTDVDIHIDTNRDLIVSNDTVDNVNDNDNDINNSEGLVYEWKACPGSLAVDYIPCLDNWKVIKKLRSRRHMEHRERYCPKPNPHCLIPLPDGYKVPVSWPKSRDMVRLLLLW